MVALTRKTDYALVALAYLARWEQGCVSARDIAARVRIPLPVLMGILNQLARQGLVVSTRGAKGGYRLARSPEQITLAQLIDAVEGPVRLTMCCTGGDERAMSECDLEATCDVKQPLQAVQRRLEAFLSGVRLADIARNTMPVELRVSARAKPPAHEDSEPDTECVGTVAG